MGFVLEHEFLYYSSIKNNTRKRKEIIMNEKEIDIISPKITE